MPRHLPNLKLHHFGRENVKRNVLAALALFALLIAAMSSPAMAEDNGPSAGPSNCVKFSGDQAAAQAYFEAGGGSANTNYEGLDDDGNGIACDEPGVFEGGGPSAHPTECAEFTDQVAAQTYFDAQGADYQNLDPDGNGITCDQPEASEQSGSDDTTETDPALGAEGASTTTSADDTVSDFPVTGSGMNLPTPAGSHISLLLGLSMVFGASALHGNRLMRR